MKFMLSTVAAALLLLTGCGNTLGTPPSDGGGGNSIGFNGGTGTSGGSVVGNGLVAVRNAKMGLEFKIPEGWKVENNENQVKVSKESSYLEFGLHQDIDGKRINSLPQLKSYLEKTFPEKTWRKTALVGKDGFWVEEITPDVHIANYYLLDENHNVLMVKFATAPLLDGERAIMEVIKSLTIDDEPPVIEKVYFEPKMAEPGETVTLVLEAWDEVSAIDVARMSTTKFPIGNWQQPRMGYQIPVKQYETGSLANAYPLHENFKQVSTNRFEYKFKIPKNAPPGEISLKMLEVYDQKGNLQRAYAWPANAHDKNIPQNLRVGSDKSIDLPLFKVTRGSGPDYFPDTTPPKLEEVYFEKSFVKQSNPKQKLFLKITDDTEVSPSLQVYHERRGETGFGYSCAKIAETMTKVDENVYAVEMDVKDCFIEYLPKEFRWDVIYVNTIKITDGVGNYLECNGDRGLAEGCKFPKTRFGLIKD